MGFIALRQGPCQWYSNPQDQDVDDLGYPDFYPSRGTEEEYKLTEKAITEGFENKPIVTVHFLLFAKTNIFIE